MVASINSDLYSPFQHPSMAEEGPSSSDDGSGLHSPVFDHEFPRNDCEFQPLRHVTSSVLICFRLNKVRYHDHISDAAGILFDYSSSLVQQPPLIDTALEAPSSGVHHVNFSIAPRNPPGIEYHPQSSVISRQAQSDLNFRYNSTERRSSGRQPHDPSPTRTSASIPRDGDQPPTPVSSVEHSESSTALSPSRLRDRREISTVVIACRQW